MLNSQYGFTKINPVLVDDPQGHPSVLHLLTFMFMFVECDVGG